MLPSVQEFLVWLDALGAAAGTQIDGRRFLKTHQLLHPLGWEGESNLEPKLRAPILYPTA